MHKLGRIWTDLGIGLKIAMVSSVCATLALASLTMVLSTAMTDYMLTEARDEIEDVVQSLETTCDLQYAMMKSRLRSDLLIAEQIFAVRSPDPLDWQSSLNFDPNTTHQVGSFTLPALRLGELTLTHNNAQVDEVLDKTRSTCTMFHVLPDKWVRVTTNVKKPDGSRAVGTTLDKSSKVYSHVLNGQTYYGTNSIQGERYETAYKPLRDANGKIVAVLYVGVPHKQFDEMSQIVTDIKIGETGYPYVMDGKGELVIHPTSVGESLAKHAFAQEMISNKKGVVEYTWEGRRKIVAYAYFEPYDWIIAAGSYEDEFTTQVRAFQWMAAGITLGLVIACAMACWFAGRTIGKRVNHVTDAIRDIAEGEGDLTRRLEVKSKDETGELCRHFNTFVDRIHQIIVQISQSSRDVASSAAEVSASSEEMTVGLSQQLEQTQNVAASLDEMTTSISDVAQRSERASDHSQQAGEAARHGGEIVSQTIDGINGVDRVVRDSSSAIEQLGRRSEEIGQIIGVINDIADQTNLLALNAAIEAARAGEHGRGFAVVADEVRKLADRTTKATEEIARSIETIQTETATAVQQMQLGTEHVAEGTELARQAGEALKGIVSGADEVAAMIQAIAAAAEQQSVTSREITAAIESISAVSHQSREGSQQAATAAADLSHKSEQLQGIVNQFKI